MRDRTRRTCHSRRARGALALLTGVVPVVAGCGIAPTDAREVARPPTVQVPPPSKTIYLLKDGRLTKEPADVESDTVESLLTALFAASRQPLQDGRDTALRGFTLEGIKDSLNPIRRDEVQLPRTSTLTVIVKGEGTLSRPAKAQIVCTAQQDAAFEQVKIVRRYENRPSTVEGRFICGDLK
ncbi:hypothetical protein HTZ77_28425 [Nonomuraea sp. SMC257]|uniref:GerMN domain-containing protein n=1 Tax=Nonomuraea montanisoli TaxID=2741721 RepID=A0A7Y6M669_9ACTN|nr:hypothetical protein [Nonomuraea montanisoli]NUW35330.1 hypothetical protein [Nonomuraea montanisoli]